MTTEFPEPKESLLFLISIREQAIIRAKELHVTLEYLLKDGAVNGYGLNPPEQINACKVGIYYWMNEIRMYDSMIKEKEQEQDEYLGGLMDE